MRRSTILGVFMSILIAGCALVPAQAAEAQLPPKADYEAALAKIDGFIDNVQPYADQHPQEYEYLNSLAFKTSDLIDNYDDADYTVRNAAAYNIAITAIDQAIESCRYVFGIVSTETLAAQAAQSSTNPAPATPSSDTVAETQTPSTRLTSAPTTVATAATTSTQASTDKKPTEKNADITTFQTTKSQSDTAAEEAPVEIPKTGGISQSSSIVFIVIVSLIAAAAATGIYFTYNRQSKPTTPAARRKRR